MGTSPRRELTSRSRALSELRVRWALEEAGLPYEERLIGPEDQPLERSRHLQPFGQVPVYEEDGLVLFESGVIVLHIAERSEALMPAESGARARAKTWMFAALNSVEPANLLMTTVLRILRHTELVAEGPVAWPATCGRAPCGLYGNTSGWSPRIRGLRSCF